MKANRSILLAFVLVVAAVAAGCHGEKETYGAPVPSSESTPIRQILASPADYADKTVVVEGRISTECPSGCWFEVEQDSPPLYVDLSGAGLAIPQYVGKTVRVVGSVSTADAQIQFDGKGVEIQ